MSQSSSVSESSSTTMMSGRAGFSGAASFGGASFMTWRLRSYSIGKGSQRKLGRSATLNWIRSVSAPSTLTVRAAAEPRRGTVTRPGSTSYVAIPSSGDRRGAEDPPASAGEDDLAHVLPLLEEAMRFRRVDEREGLRDHGPDVSTIVVGEEPEHLAPQHR